jgi:hypothetical protein
MEKYMKNEDFEFILEKANLNKKKFAELTSLPYQTIMNWKRSDNVPGWVKSWLENYMKAKDIDKVAQTMRPYIDCEDK